MKERRVEGNAQSYLLPFWMLGRVFARLSSAKTVTMSAMKCTKVKKAVRTYPTGDPNFAVMQVRGTRKDGTFT